MSTNHHGLTSYDIQSGPFSELELREQWNAQANEYYQWADLALCQQLAWAQTRAIAADRAQGAPRDMPPPVAAADRPRYLRVLQDAYSVTQQPDIFSKGNERLTIAAEIRAVRDWLVPEDGPRPGISWPMERAAWDARQSIRALLTTEADRAERGE